MPELEKRCHDMRSRDQKPELFPAKLNRVMLGQAEAGPTKYSEVLCAIANQALYSAIRFPEESTPEDPKLIFGDAAELADQLARWLPRLYSEMLPLLQNGAASEPRFWHVLIEEVFVPTFFLELCNARQHNQGNELTPSDCWYLPRVLRGTTELPFQRVFTAWLNAAGCRGPEDIGKLTQSDSNRRTAHNWLKSENPPRPSQIKRFLDNFKAETDRFADLRVWKGRLAFAAAMQRLCRQMDDYFSKVQPGYSFRLLEMLSQVHAEPVPIDCDEVLMTPKTYFAARLIFRRLKNSEQWKAAIAAIPQQKSFTADRAVTHGELEAIQKQIKFDLNPGNLLLKFIRDELPEFKGTGKIKPEYTRCIADEIFAHGIRELNKMLLKKGPVAV